MQSADKELRIRISEIDAQISQINTEITEKLNIRDAPKFAVDTENPAMEKNISLYATNSKQVFIAIDKIHSYDKTASSIVEEHSVIQLSNVKRIFDKQK